MKKHAGLVILLMFSTLIMSYDKLRAASTGTHVSTSTQQTTNQPTATQQSATQQPHQAPVEQDPMLSLFNQSIKLATIASHIAVDENKNEGALLTYRLNNISKYPITSVAWTTVFVANNKIFHVSNVVVSLEKQALQPNSSAEIRVLNLFNKMPKQAQAIFKTPSQKFNTVFVAREISFANGSKVIISE